LRRNLIIQSSKQGLDIALLENDRLVELHQDVANQEFQVGDIYIGKVKKVLPSLNAAFIDIGHEKNAFLHYHDLGPTFTTLTQYTKRAFSDKQLSANLKYFKLLPEIPKNGDIGKVIDTSQQVVVQIVKEPISTKGHRLTSEITLPGRYLVLMPFHKGISISKRIRDKDERKRLAQIFNELLPNNFGLIVRTAAESRPVHQLEQDLKTTLSRWQSVVNNLKKGETKLLGEYNKATSILRDLLNDTFDLVVVNDQETHTELENYIAEILPDKKKILRFHKEKTSPFEYYNIDKQLKASFGKIVNFGKGAYLVIEHTEAMHVIDINSGSKNFKDADRDDTVLKINMDAADEIARQLRLRDIGGLIVVDFIDMKSHENKRKLLEYMKTTMRNDKTQHSCLPISRFGLMEITRQRVKPALELSTTETCPVCRGSGEIKPTVLVVDDIEHSLNFISNETNTKKIILKVHPFIKAYIQSGLFSKRLEWMRKYKIFVKVVASQALHLIDYKILDKEGNDLEEF
jgi:ribonuclease G